MASGDSDKTIDQQARDVTFGGASRKHFGADNKRDKTLAANETILLSGSTGTGNAISPVQGRLPADVGGYEILGELGRGGMGVVYKARNRELNRVVALKMILAGSHAGEEAILRFRSEAEAVAQLHHPNIVQVFEVGQSDGQPWCALEYVEGSNLDEFLKSRELKPEEAARMIEILARAIQTAHSTGIVHRDLKPGNILLGNSGGRNASSAAAESLVPKITDFGLAKRVEQESGNTLTGSIVGTPNYMSPEQAKGNVRVGPASDIYSLGAILYRLLARRPPFEGESPIKTVMRVIAAEPVAPSVISAGLDRDLETICLKCLEKEPARRYPSAEHLAQDLARYLSNEPILARPCPWHERTLKWIHRKPWAATAAGLMILGIVGTIAGGLIFNRSISSAYRKVDQERGRAVEALEAESKARREATEATARAEASARESRRRLVDSHVINGLEALESGDPLRALPWFSEAIRLEDESGRRAAHAMRLEAAIVNSPKVIDTWLTDELVSHVQISNDGKRFLCATGIGDIVVRDAVSRKTLHRFALPGQLVQLAASPDLERFAVAVAMIDEKAIEAGDANIVELRMYDGNTLQPNGTGIRFRARDRFGDGSLAISIAAGTCFLYNPEDEKRVDAHDLVSGSSTGSFDAGSPIRKLLVNPSGQRVAVLADRLYLLDAKTMEPVPGFEPPAGPIAMDSVSLTDTLLVYGDQQVFVHECETGSLAARIEPGIRVQTVYAAPDGNSVVLSGPGGSVEIRDRQGRLVNALDFASHVNKVLFSNEVPFAAVATDSRVWRIDLMTGRTIGAPVVAVNLPITSVSLAENGESVATAGGSGLLDGRGGIRVWGLTSEPQMEVVEGISGGSPILRQHISPDGLWIARLSDDGMAVEVVSTAGPGSPQTDSGNAANSAAAGGSVTESAKVRRYPLPKESPAANLELVVRFSPDSNRLFAGLRTGGGVVYSLIDDTLRPVGPYDAINDAVFSSDGKWLGIDAGRESRTLNLHRVSDGQRTLGPVECTRSPQAIGFNNDSTLFVAVTRDLQIRHWSTGNGELVRQHNAGIFPIEAVIDPQHNLLTIAGTRLGRQPGRVRLIDLTSGEDRCPPMDFSEEVVGVEVSPDRQIFAVILANGSVELHEPGKEQTVSPPFHHPDQVFDVAISPDHSMMLTACRDQRVRLFDLETAQLVAFWRLENAEPNQLSFVRGKDFSLIGGDKVRRCLLPPSTRPRDELMKLAMVYSAQIISSQGVLQSVGFEQLANAPEVTRENRETAAGLSTGADGPATVVRENEFGRSFSSAFRQKFPQLPEPADPGQAISLRYQFPEGTVRRYLINTAVTTEVMGAPNDQSEQVIMVCRSLGQTERGFRVQTSYERARVETKSVAGELLIDTENPELTKSSPIFEFVSELFKVLYRSQVEHEVTGVGKIPDFQAPEALKTAIAANSQPGGAAFSAESLSTNFLLMWTEVPERQVSSGGQWESLPPVSVFTADETSSQTTLAGVAKIDGEERIILVVRASSAGKPQSSPLFRKITSDSESVYCFDPETGCIDRAFIGSEGVAEMLIRNVAIEQIISTRIELRLLKDGE
jgi:serine/threonine protein kinase/WD40 repeat protein